MRRPPSVDEKQVSRLEHALSVAPDSSKLTVPRFVSAPEQSRASSQPAQQQRTFRAQHQQPAMGAGCSGQSPNRPITPTNRRRPVPHSEQPAASQPKVMQRSASASISPQRPILTRSTEELHGPYMRLDAWPSASGASRIRIESPSERKLAPPQASISVAAAKDISPSRGLVVSDGVKSVVANAKAGASPRWVRRVVGRSLSPSGMPTLQTQVGPSPAAPPVGVASSQLAPEPPAPSFLAHLRGGGGSARGVRPGAGSVNHSPAVPAAPSQSWPTGWANAAASRSVLSTDVANHRQSSLDGSLSTSLSQPTLSQLPQPTPHVRQAQAATPQKTHQAQQHTVQQSPPQPSMAATPSPGRSRANSMLRPSLSPAPCRGASARSL